MDKDEKLYKEKYGDIPKDYVSRINLLLSQVKTRKHKELIIPYIQRALNIQYKHIGFTIYLEPKSTPRPRSNSRSNIFYVKGAAINKKRFNKFLDSIEYERITTGTKFNVDAYLPCPSSMNKVERILAEMGLIRPLTTPDFDNIVKTYSDMIQNKLLLDDSLIFDGHIKKYLSIKPRIEINIEYAEGFDSEYNEKLIIRRLEKENSR